MTMKCLLCNAILDYPIGSPMPTHKYMWHYMQEHLYTYRQATDQALADKVSSMELKKIL